MVENTQEMRRVGAKQRLDEVRGMYKKIRPHLSPEEIKEWDDKLKELENVLEAMGCNNV
jgi:hypothetical protein